jgi:hypothetical protein
VLFQSAVIGTRWKEGGKKAFHPSFSYPHHKDALAQWYILNRLLKAIVCQCFPFHRNGIYYYISPFAACRVSKQTLDNLSSYPSVFGFKPVAVVAEFVSQKKLVYPTYRLYDEFSGPLTASLLQTLDGKLQPLSAQIPSTATLTQGVPSRLYSLNSRRHLSFLI